MNTPKAKFTWHYYLMAFGALMGLMALTLSAWSAAASALGFMVMSHPVLQLKGPTRFIFLALFAAFYYAAFPDPSVVQEMMKTAE
ncbi:hypothetical protein [Thiosulfativibrio zosterae]|uniref:Uncharacterized protein n=1 Tax=Thiosulfativibrio zosterae TaxID=2675053 RepID=A0A6F8PNU7_9GAMM|nr:hypothetical protein [Thiosulfativibrio zosterae]BBP43707.1 hypothetical protein THMIRHAT_14530 [Thiosulfativibrio zosterae]